jgi:hypothetical protein
MSFPEGTMVQPILIANINGSHFIYLDKGAHYATVLHYENDEISRKLLPSTLIPKF